MIPVVAGIDIGGTATRLLIRGRHGTVAARIEATATFGGGATEARVSRLADMIIALVPDGHALRAVGIGATGPVERSTGIIRNPDTLPMFSGFALTQELQGRLNVQVLIDNDAVAAALAEATLGAGQRADRMLMVTLGTGIGVALLIDGVPFRGPDGAHPEAGHISIRGGGPRCYCGAVGCWEGLASRARLQTMLRPWVAETVPDHEVVDRAAASAADTAIAAIFATYGDRVGHGLAALHSVFRPNVIVLGGSAAKHLDLFRAALMRRMSRMPGYAVPLELRKASLGDGAGALGAASLVIDSLD